MTGRKGAQIRPPHRRLHSQPFLVRSPQVSHSRGLRQFCFARSPCSCLPPCARFYRFLLVPDLRVRINCWRFPCLQLQAPPPSGWTHSSGATDAPEWRAVVRIGDLLRGAVCSRVHVGALGATHDANMVRPRAPLECNLLLLHTPALSVLRTGLLTVAWRCRVAPGFGFALASGGPIGGLKGCGRGAAVTGVRQAHRRAGTVATGANSVSMLLEGSLVECVGAGVIKVRALPRCTCPRRSP